MIAYLYLCHHPWTTSQLMRYIVEAFLSGNQGNSWWCQVCSWRSFSGIWGDLPCQMVSLRHITLMKQWDSIYIYKCSIVLGPLPYCWAPWFKIVGSRTMVTADHVRGAVGVYSVLCGMIYPCQIWSMPHITFIKWWDIIPRHVSSSLDHYTIGEVHGSFAWVQEPE